MKKNKKNEVQLVNKLAEVMPEFDGANVVTEYRLPKDFKAKTGIDARRFWHLWKNPEEQMSLQEAQNLKRYLEEQSGQSVSIEDLFEERNFDQDEEE